MKPELLQPPLGRESLEEIAMVALEFGRLLMETGARARNVDEITGQVAARSTRPSFTQVPRPVNRKA